MPLANPLGALGLVPDSIEPIVAWRAWKFGGDPGPLLHSRGDRERWPARRSLTAVCYAIPGFVDGLSRAWSRSHLAPAPGCTCGIYGSMSEEGALDVVRALTPTYPDKRAILDIVHGEVALFGTVIEHESGYRAERAYPLRVLVPRSFRSFLLDDDRRRIRRLWADEAAALIAERYRIEAALV